jgi:aldehyde dehydrogenase (NAD+)
MSLAIPENALLIDGGWARGSGNTYGVINPATEESITEVSEASIADAERAVTAARRAFDEGPWPRMRPAERAVYLQRMADIFERRRDEITDIVVAETGCPISLTRSNQIGFPFEFFRDLADRIAPSLVSDDPMPPYAKPGVGLGQGIMMTEPLGVAALLTAFNFPMNLNLFKLGPALAAGCTVVLKPSPYTPMTALVVGQVAEEAGLPPGVVNIVLGDVEIGQYLSTAPEVDIVSFTGSDAVGRRVYQQAAGGLKRVVLELGGKSANLLLEDCTIEKAYRAVIANFTIHSGQGCSLLTRTLVHRTLYDDLLERVVDTVRSLRIGDPTDPATNIGPLMSALQRERVEGYVQVGRDEGGRVAVGGTRPDMERGFYYEPTLFVDVDNSMRISREEIFGPVGVVIPFDSDDEAVAIANDSEYGLGAGVWSGDPERGLRVARQVRAGYIDLNGGGPPLSPHGGFGGVKNSGLGREWGYEGIREFQMTKTITWGVAAG